MNGDSIQVALAHFQPSRDSSTDSGEEEDDEKNAASTEKDEREALLVEDEDSVELQFLAEEDRQHELGAGGGPLTAEGIQDEEDEDIFNSVP